jgi:hypothetical protein
MGFSTIGVAQSLLAKCRFRCACLVAVFNLPVSTITLAADLLMVGMANGMLLGMLLNRVAITINPASYPLWGQQYSAGLSDGSWK